MINPHAKCRLGFPPIPFFRPGSIGIVSKSGTLSYETVASTTLAGVGQSLVIGIGGDPLPGTDFVDVLNIFEHDKNTKGIIIVGEIGGYAEHQAAEWIKDYRKRVKDPKYVLLFFASLFLPLLNDEDQS
jgi:succinyl-CoA synthetase alpha subunit